MVGELHKLIAATSAKPAGENQWKACCPAHDDSNASLAISFGEKGVVIHCHAGCPTEAIVGAVGMTMADLFHEKRQRRESRPTSTVQRGGFDTAADAIAAYEATNGPRSCEWVYRDAAGVAVGYVLRWDASGDKDKVIRPITLAADGRWSLCAMPKPRPLFNLPDVANATHVAVVEGEKCADAAKLIGQVATTAAGGAKAAALTDWSPLAGKHVVLWPDPDEPGEKYVADIRSRLSTCSPPPKSIKIFNPGADAADWVQRGGTREQFAAAVSNLPEAGTSEAPTEEPIEPVRVVTAAEFLATEYPIEYIVDDVLVAGEFGVVGGKSKSMKTTTAVDLTLSIGLGVKFLGHFQAKKKRVAIISGESGGAVIQETLKRIAFSRNVNAADSETYWGMDLPCLGSERGLDSLKAMIDEHGIQVVVIDPLYLSLIGEETKDAREGSLFSMGPLYDRIAKSCLTHGATPIVLHHTSKGSENRRERFSSPELSDLSQSGITEYVRQWILLGRRSEYRSNGHHELHLKIGGSAGHSSEWALDIDEGVPDKHHGRRYEVTLKTAYDESERRKNAAEARKETDRKDKLEQDMRKVVGFLRKSPSGETANVIREAVGVNSIKCKAIWKPREVWRFAEERDDEAAQTEPHLAAPEFSRGEIAWAWVPWAILSVCVFVWGIPQVRTLLDGGKPAAAAATTRTSAAVDVQPKLWELPNFLAGVSVWQWAVPQLDKLIQPDATVIAGEAKPMAAEFRLNWLSATGTGIFVAAILSAAWLGISPRQFGRSFFHTFVRLRSSLITIAAMLARAYVTRFSGSDVTLGLAFTRTGVFYPFFAAMLGWLGVALTGSDTSSNALFGNLQRITAERLGLNPILICAANSTGGVMGKMIDAQSIVVASAATGQHNAEGQILRFVFWHSIVLACLVGLLTLAQAYWLPWMIP